MKAVTSEMLKKIDLNKATDQGFAWSGNLPLAYFDRIKEVVVNKPHEDCVLSCTVETVNNLVWLSFDFNATLWLDCQRCLDPVSFELNRTYKIALLATENQVSSLKDDMDYLMLSEVTDNNEVKPFLPIKELIEDELLLNIPLSPKHDDCEMTFDSFGEIIEEEPENPFAALGSLKSSL